MNQIATDSIISKTKKWITDVVVGCNFCPFAAKEVKKDSIHYAVLQQATKKTVLETVMQMIYQLDDNENIETSFLIIPDSFLAFDEYLDLVGLVERLIEKENYEGIYQVASFHPAYLFAGSTPTDPSNYTNRSPYPMLHFLREDSVSKAISSYPDIGKVPERNIAFTKEKGLLYMQQLFSNS